MSIDCYAILGVLPSAEDVVIRAAYRALANRYHPDKFEGSVDEASRRMKEINAAYAILSDPTKRTEYDKARGTGSQDGDPYFGNESNDQPPPYDPLEGEWAVAIKYYPDIVELEARLAKIAWRLGYSYRAFMIAEKAFPARVSVADTLENQFLQSYFGTNKQILAFAKMVVRAGKKQAAKALNNAVRIFGNNIEPDRVIDQIKAEYLPEIVKAEVQQRAEEAEQLRREQARFAEDADKRRQEEQVRFGQDQERRRRNRNMLFAAEVAGLITFGGVVLWLGWWSVPLVVVAAWLLLHLSRK